MVKIEILKAHSGANLIKYVFPLPLYVSRFIVINIEVLFSLTIRGSVQVVLFVLLTITLAIVSCCNLISINSSYHIRSAIS